ncbi:hypothetical protein BZA05DRAFT_394998 [Tricharina praecox]|uniref:uncharacterized protein n=1 Tax=Tricharina praecox TaxID=43433 RepID=UPI00221F37F5|nr:uncharacterized protein BZA05DRAFT_394998 [Tricharina praecox]KAI5853888.1 hypothetical protein BZA05DRAFT_394998 [Tricharina praecox]
MIIITTAEAHEHYRLCLCCVCCVCWACWLALHYLHCIACITYIAEHLTPQHVLYCNYVREMFSSSVAVFTFFSSFVFLSSFPSFFFADVLGERDCGLWRKEETKVQPATYRYTSRLCSHGMIKAKTTEIAACLSCSCSCSAVQKTVQKTVSFLSCWGLVCQ